MPKVLTSFEDLGKAVHSMQQAGLTSHPHTMKDWDMFQINDLLNNYPKNAYILDMGCGGSHVLRLFYEKGFVNCTGIDLTISRTDRMTQVKFMFSRKPKRPYRRMKRPYRLMRMNMMKTNFPDSYFDLVVSLSVIEHEVDLNAFFKEAYRILKNGGVLFLTTDYWEPKISTDQLKIYGLKWNIFSKKELENLVRLSEEYGFSSSDHDFPSVGETFVHWKGKNYTFASVTLKKGN